jgi:hypothetical protein
MMLEGNAGGVITSSKLFKLSIPRTGSFSQYLVGACHKEELRVWAGVWEEVCGGRVRER